MMKYFAQTEPTQWKAATWYCTCEMVDQRHSLMVPNILHSTYSAYHTLIKIDVSSFRTHNFLPPFTSLKRSFRRINLIIECMVKWVKQCATIVLCRNDGKCMRQWLQAYFLCANIIASYQCLSTKLYHTNTYWNWNLMYFSVNFCSVCILHYFLQ